MGDKFVQKIHKSEQYGAPVSDLAGRSLPELGWPIGYAALITRYGLRLPLPPRLAMAAAKERAADEADWLILRGSRGTRGDRARRPHRRA